MLDEAQGIYQGKNKGARNEKNILSLSFNFFYFIFTDVVGTTILTITRVENES